MVNFTVEKCSVWKILIKMYLFMVTIIKLSHKDIGCNNIQNCFIHLKDLPVLTKISDLHHWSDDSSNRAKNMTAP